MEIKNYHTASQKLQWAKMAYQLWIEEQQFLLELKLTLDDESRFLIPLLKASEVKTKNSLVDNTLHAKFENKEGKQRKIAITYSKIEEVYQDIKESVDENLLGRVN